ncbi:hypothetical protein CGLO_14408 [Colletotrichum gloeosporioides Cg-14]|uniref:Uncharacterized protein n=1 Tax=Colletotrichum gloeosporioides (strain Cg-14) TaxID=1237896 RepID=T0JUC3_COLGC|nr:hypothetical protein CGLO_14408 [Colletotrichum gloeosporioides Cg-14]
MTCAFEREDSPELD